MNIDTGHEKRITVFVEQVFPSMVNNYGTLFGGFALQWMDKAAWFVSTRYARQTMVTVASEEIIFKHPVPQGSMVELRGEIAKVGRTSITVQVEMFCEESLTGKRTLATTGRFVMVAIDDHGKPQTITPPDALPGSSAT